MVENSRETLRFGTIKPVNEPELLRVEEIAGLPNAVTIKRRYQIETIEDRWRIDDEWWRNEPVTRLYYAVLLSEGHRLIIYKDLITGYWYRQGY